ncbi:hypothetical protein HK102_011007 [Quaeritorhiza haematococci]|nr:hypothetical protein HK102_011007 [Quaeritorhiza haematococci]
MSRIISITSLFVLATTSKIWAAPVGNDASGNSLAPAATGRNRVDEAEVRPLTSNHPALGFASPAVVNKNKNRAGNGGIESAENSDGQATGTGNSVAALETHFNAPFERVLSQMPTSGSAQTVPFPGDYWPMFRDGINFKWEGPQSQSPTEKYALAFGIDPKQLSDALSQTSGIDSARSFRPPCTTTADCSSLNDGSVCSFREGETSGVCIPGWFGICHAWAPAAILEPEPKCPVTLNNVTFKVNDLKALITQMYDGTAIGTVFGGGRCDDVEPPTDIHGRYSSFECRDLTSDFFHIAVTNMLGSFSTSFVADVDARAEVWNQPVRSFEIIQNTPITLDEGAKLINPELQTYPFNQFAVSLAHIKMRFDYIVESRQDGPLVSTGLVDQFTKQDVYEYVLELDANGVIIGGEWVGISKTNHPDFLWLPQNRPSDDTTVAGGINYATVRNLLEQSANGQC